MDWEEERRVLEKGRGGDEHIVGHLALRALIASPRSQPGWQPCDSRRHNLARVARFPTAAMDVTTVVKEHDSLMRFVQNQQMKGKNVDDVLSCQCKNFVSKIELLKPPLSPENAETLQDVIDSGAWHADDKMRMSSAVFSKISDVSLNICRIGGGGRKCQSCLYLDNYLTQASWERIQGNANVTQAILELAMVAERIGLQCISECTYKVMTGILCSQCIGSTTMSPHSMYELNETVKEVTRTRLLSTKYPHGYRLEYPVNPFDLPSAVFEHAYGEAVPVPSPASTEIRLCANRKFARKSATGLTPPKAAGPTSNALSLPGSSSAGSKEDDATKLGRILMNFLAGTREEDGALPISYCDNRDRRSLRMFKPRSVEDTLSRIEKEPLAALADGVEIKETGKERGNASRRTKEDGRRLEWAEETADNTDDDAEGGPLSTLRKEMAKARAAAADSKTAKRLLALKAKVFT